MNIICLLILSKLFKFHKISKINKDISENKDKQENRKEKDVQLWVNEDMPIQIRAKDLPA